MASRFEALTGLRIVFDTNILIASLISKDGPPDQLYRAWKAKRFTPYSCELQLEEMNRVGRRAGLRLRLKPADAGRMVNELRAVANLLDNLPVVEVSPDPYDNFLLALAQAADADFLITGDKRDLLSIARHGRSRIVTARQALNLITTR